MFRRIIEKKDETGGLRWRKQEKMNGFWIFIPGC